MDSNHRDAGVKFQCLKPLGDTPICIEVYPGRAAQINPCSCITIHPQQGNSHSNNALFQLYSASFVLANNDVDSALHAEFDYYKQLQSVYKPSSLSGAPKPPKRLPTPLSIPCGFHLFLFKTHHD